MITIYEHLARMLDLPLTSHKFTTSTFNLANIPNPSGEWMYVTTDATSGDEIAIDIDSGIQQGNFVRFWQRRTFNIPDEQGARVALFYLAMDCSTGCHRIEKDIYLNSLGMVVAEGLKPGGLQYAMPDTWEGELFQCVCPIY
ncbi:MAG TPA: hypothetical protein DCP31_29390 [Cyanobacteria bacterium UBA8543]|nr:hypothetical protein [Cyanobacteria bacterium UBA8543]